MEGGGRARKGNGRTRKDQGKEGEGRERSHGRRGGPQEVMLGVGRAKRGQWKEVGGR